MKQTSFQINGNEVKQHNSSLLFSHYLRDRDYGLYLEDYFKEILYLERKRTERSKKPFLLMLLDFTKIDDFAEKIGIMEGAAGVLRSLTREIDLKGWYEYNSVMGVIFTEINGNDKDSLRQKMDNHLCRVLDRGEISGIKISWHVFPEEDVKQKAEADLELYPDLEKRDDSKRLALFLKRTTDIIGSLLGILLFSPFFIILPLLIKLTSEGPVFFRQERVGRYGKKFTFLKFRSMHINNDPAIHKEYTRKLISGQQDAKGADGEGNCSYKIKDDPRVTPIGRFLRKSSLDELPQFFNVLKGEMSLVGPRPPIPYELESYDIWHRRRLLEIKPGITGIWQVHGRSSTTFDEMVRMDIKYIREWSIWMDIKLLLKTPWVILTGKGAY
ncbi:Undecaprenyl-phosphate galactosephosphotransferase [hydrothermal vent metagenome]|uniref:Undecaprenyl-phosphate galactosephosphotransferase n=2 Tax=hydrothermal vent metagenome TaxID=652676 RepID=A0A3B1CMQ9_9ZZZZ